MAKILFFGRLRDIAGPNLDAALDANLATVGDLRGWLAARDPVLGEALRARGIRVAVDQAFATDRTSVSNAVEIAFMSPLSGG